MEITLQERTTDHVRTYFERTQDDQIDQMLPRSVNSLDQALENFAQTKLSDAKSYGKTIYADDRYIGDIWCYCIDPTVSTQKKLPTPCSATVFLRKAAGEKELLPVHFLSFWMR